MKVVVTHGRGLGIEIDGQRPAKGGWTCGDSQDGMGLDCHTSLTDRQGVAIGEHRVLGIKYDETMDNVGQGTNPKTMTLITEEERIDLKVIKIDDDEGECKYSITATC